MAVRTPSQRLHRQSGTIAANTGCAEEPLTAAATMKQRRGFERERRLAWQLAGHFAMGAGLGAAFALWLLWSNTQRIFDLISGSTAPLTMTLVLVVGVSVQFAFGAAITAFLLIMSEES
jgi:hypothetical protein